MPMVKMHEREGQTEKQKREGPLWDNDRRIGMEGMD